MLLRSVCSRLRSSSRICQNPLPQSNLALSKVNISSATRVISVGDKSIEIPTNLKLAAPEVITEAPKVKVDIPIEMQFPLVHVPPSIDVRKFVSESQEIVGQTPLEKTIFEVPIRVDIIHELVRYIRNKRRQPKKTKTIAEIKGSNKKPRPQKKVGMSQMGNRRNSAVRGGQKAHGPVIRDYAIGMPKKARALATMMTLAAKFREGNLLIVDSLDLETLKTKDFVTTLKRHQLHDKLLLFVDTGFSDHFTKASRNVPTIETRTLRHLNGYEILRKEKLVITRQAFQLLQEKLLYQYSQSGKHKANRRNLASYLSLVEAGSRLVQQV